VQYRLLIGSLGTLKGTIVAGSKILYMRFRNALASGRTVQR